VLEVVNRRKAENASFGPKRDDLLDLLLRDPTFNNDEVIVDELLTIFFAGS
jgi:cytochrome P450